MAGGIYLDFSGLLKGVKAIDSINKKLSAYVDRALDAGADIVTDRAKLLAPKNFGQLAGAIAPDKTVFLEKHITVNVPYAAYMEFGTGRYAAKYVAGLPPDWQTYARRFKGKTGGGLDKFLEVMVLWVKRKGLVGLTKSGRARTGKKADADAYNIAYVIIINILRNGVQPHPYLFPAMVNSRAKIEQLIKDAINAALNNK